MHFSVLFPLGGVDPRSQKSSETSQYEEEEKDNCADHNMLPHSDNVCVEVLLPNCTAVLQPLDLGIIRTLKVYYCKEMLRKSLVTLVKECLTGKKRLLDKGHRHKPGYKGTGVLTVGKDACFSDQKVSEFHSLAPMYYRGSAAAVIVYDITKMDTFQTLKKWVKELKEHGPEDIVVAIAGNKSDLSDIREVPGKEAKEYAETISAIFIETSARNAVNIEELFQKISRQIPPLDPQEYEKTDAFKLTRPPPASSKRCC
ncbi:RAB31 protein, partial [Polypterus senegalus]